MHIWTIENWKKYYNISDSNHRTGLRIRFDKSVNANVKRAVKDFAGWMRYEYFFPIRIPIYIKDKYRIIAKDGDKVCGTFFGPENICDEPYIRIAVGDYDYLLNKRPIDDVLASYLSVIAHELTHYYQWANGLELTPIGEERQATMYARYIMDEYAETREHP